MNRGFLIILVPAILVALGYLAVFHHVGIAPQWGKLAGVIIAFIAGIWWLGRRQKKKGAAGN